MPASRFSPAPRSGLVGPNGAGKTTIFRIITGEEEVDGGDITRAKKTTIGYFSQDVGDMAGRSALDEVMAGSAETVRLAGELKTMEAAMCEPQSDDEMAALLERYGAVQEEFEHRGGYDLDTRAQTVLTGLGIGPDRFNHPVESFSGGWKMRIALAGILTLKPDVLLLDEPTNHLDVESIIWLEEWLATEFKGALLMTSHDREFMNRVVTRIVEVANQTITTYSGNYDFYETGARHPARAAPGQPQAAAGDARQGGGVHRPLRRPRLPCGPGAVAGEEDRQDRADRDPPRRADGPLRVQGAAPQRRRRGHDGEPRESLDTPDGGEHPVFSGVTGMVRRLDKIAVVGVNGAGKSTFLKILAGETEPTAGSVASAPAWNSATSASTPWRSSTREKTVFETVQDVMPLANIGVIRNLLGAFLFQGDDVDKRVENLSGGEKSRVVLATLLARPVNFLVLDEPTNHLDIRSREMLLEALAELLRHRGAGQPRPPLPPPAGGPGLRDRPRRDAGLRGGLRLLSRESAWRGVSLSPLLLYNGFALDLPGGVMTGHGLAADAEHLVLTRL